MVIDTSLRLGCLYEPPLPDDGAAYLDYLGRLLNSPPRLLPADSAQPDRPVLEKWEEQDLLVYYEPERPAWRRWLGWTTASRLVEKSRASVLVVRRPRWPLRQILLILRADESDEAAVRWLERLARPARAEVLILPIIPPLPALYSHGRLPIQEEVLLAPNTFSGAQIHRLEALCAGLGLESRLLLHDNEPQARIAWAMQNYDCDLIILGDEPHNWIHRRLLGEIVRPLLGRCDRPLLIARDPSALQA
jgi:nucleotide-binding universal stress UspA family protein